MKRTVVLLLVVLSLALAGCSKNEVKPVTKGALKPAKKNPVIVTIDLDRITKESKAGKTRYAEIKKWAEARQEEIGKKVAEIRAAEAMGKTSGRRLQAMQDEVGRMGKQSQEEFNKRRMQAADEMTKLFDPLIDKLAKQNGWDVVLNKVPQVSVWTSDALDETDYVIAQLNKTGAAAPAETPGVPPKTASKGAAK